MPTYIALLSFLFFQETKKSRGSGSVLGLWRPIITHKNSWKGAYTEFLQPRRNWFGKSPSRWAQDSIGFGISWVSRPWKEDDALSKSQT